MTELPHLREVFELLRSGHHLSPEDEPAFSAVASRHDDYAAYFAPLGLRLVRHPQDFFYFEPEGGETMPQTLPRIAVFAYILIDHAANAGRVIEDYVFNTTFLLDRLPHFSLDRYAALLRQVEVDDLGGLRLIVKSMERLGWVKFTGEDEFRFLRPIHRVFDKCLELARRSGTGTQLESSGESPANP
ncbi:MAG TPA: hypothetical protein PKM73_00515 [Verrucomicrobiota bacterium]|nr:hypothetical protein [Verrucomicrobiota bacterium]HNU49823.1 hypothetical protein [Verrucomicrobiota bacterium]